MGLFINPLALQKKLLMDFISFHLYHLRNYFLTEPIDLFYKSKANCQKLEMVLFSAKMFSYITGMQKFMGLLKADDFFLSNLQRNSIFLRLIVIYFQLTTTS